MTVLGGYRESPGMIPKFSLVSFHSLNMSLVLLTARTGEPTKLRQFFHASTDYLFEPSKQPGQNCSCSSLLVWVVVNIFTTENFLTIEENV